MLFWRGAVPTGNFKTTHGNVSIAFNLRRLKKTVKMRQSKVFQVNYIGMLHLFSSPNGGSKRIR